MTFEPSVVPLSASPSLPSSYSPAPDKMPSVMQDFVQRRASFQKIAKKIQNRISWAGEELEWLSQELPPQTRRKPNGSEAANEGEKAKRRRSLLDNLFGGTKEDEPVAEIDIGQLRLGADVVHKLEIVTRKKSNGDQVDDDAAPATPNTPSVPNGKTKIQKLSKRKAKKNEEDTNGPGEDGIENADDADVTGRAEKPKADKAERKEKKEEKHEEDRAEKLKKKDKSKLKLESLPLVAVPVPATTREEVSQDVADDGSEDKKDKKDRDREKEKDKKRDKEKEKDKDKEKEKEKEKEKDKEKEREKKEKKGTTTSVESPTLSEHDTATSEVEAKGHDASPTTPKEGDISARKPQRSRSKKNLLDKQGTSPGMLGPVRTDSQSSNQSSSSYSEQKTRQVLVSKIRTYLDSIDTEEPKPTQQAHTPTSQTPAKELKEAKELGEPKEVKKPKAPKVKASKGDDESVKSLKSDDEAGKVAKESKKKENAGDILSKRRGSSSEILSTRKKSVVAFAPVAEAKTAPLEKEPESSGDDLVAKKRKAFQMRSRSSGNRIGQSPSQQDKLNEKVQPPLEEQVADPQPAETSPVLRTKVGRAQAGKQKSLSVNMATTFRTTTVVEPEFFENSKRSSFCIPHRFQRLTSLTPSLFRGVKCAQCAQVIRVIKGNASKCNECGIFVHHHCESLTPPTCGISKELLSFNQNLLPDYFGVDLEQQAKQEGRSIPRLVTLCVHAIEDRGLEVEGLYRVSGTHTSMDRLRVLFRYGRPNLDDAEWKDISVVTGVLKQYFRELPIPLGTFDLYNDFMQLTKLEKDDEKFFLIQHLLDMLPPVHYATLRYMIHHLKRVADYSHLNKMKIHNLALILGPTLFRSGNEARDLFDMQYQSKLMHFLITNCPIIFPQAPPPSS